LDLEDQDRIDDLDIDLPVALQEDAFSDKQILAKIYFDCGEYDRCAHVLDSAKQPAAVFLRLYAKYIVCFATTVMVYKLLTAVWRKEERRGIAGNSGTQG
jgi:hypothetical protein